MLYQCIVAFPRLRLGELLQHLISTEHLPSSVVSISEDPRADLSVCGQVKACWECGTIMNFLQHEACLECDCAMFVYLPSTSRAVDRVVKLLNKPKNLQQKEVEKQVYSLSLSQLHPKQNEQW